MKKLSIVPGIPAPPKLTKAAVAVPDDPAKYWEALISDPTLDISPPAPPQVQPEAPAEATPDRTTKALAGVGKGTLLGAGGLGALGLAGKIPWPKVKADLYRLAKKEMGAEAGQLSRAVLGRTGQLSKALRNVITQSRAAGTKVAPKQLRSMVQDMLAQAGVRSTKPRTQLLSKFMRGAMKHTTRPGLFRRTGELARRISARLGPKGQLAMIGVPAALLGGLGLFGGGKEKSE